MVFIVRFISCCYIMYIIGWISGERMTTFYTTKDLLWHFCLSRFLLFLTNLNRLWCLLLKAVHVEGRFIPCVCTWIVNGKVKRRWIAYNLVKTDCFHRCPDWMTLHLHVILEDLLRSLPEIVKFSNPITRTIYHFLHGLICAYPLNEILQFIKRESKWNSLWIRPSMLQKKLCFMLLNLSKRSINKF